MRRVRNLHTQPLGPPRRECHDDRTNRGAGPAFADYLRQFLFCGGYTQTFDLLGLYCRGLLSDLGRKTCEPLALYAGVAVRTLQEFLKDQRTGEEKSFVSGAPPGTALGRLLRVGFGRWNAEHCFRVSKGEVGVRDFQGRSYVGLMRHVTLCLVALTFAAGQAARRRGAPRRGGARR
jgi:hypothetical protein